MAVDNLQAALSSFRTALRIDARHYNAWFALLPSLPPFPAVTWHSHTRYGLGMVYYRQEKYPLAEYHFRKALAINPHSSILHCYVGVVACHPPPFSCNHTPRCWQRMDEQKRPSRNWIMRSTWTLPTLLRDTSVLRSSSPSSDTRFESPLSFFCPPKISLPSRAVWLSLASSQETQEELQKLLDGGPKEAAVWVLMGRVCKRLGQHERAVSCLNTALEMDAKNASHIQELLDALHLPDDAEENEAEQQNGEEEDEDEENAEVLDGEELGDRSLVRDPNTEEGDMNDEALTPRGDGDAHMSMGELNDSLDYEPAGGVYT